MAIMKLKITGKKAITYKGSEVFDVPTGTILKVTHGNNSAVDDIVIRTDEREKPFVSIWSKHSGDIGFLWGSGIENYHFQLLEYDFVEVDPESLK